MDEFVRLGVHGLLTRVRELMGDEPVYLCWDMDVFDPSVSPGVVTPSWGGITVREGLAILRGLRGLGFVAYDINTVSPPHDPQGQTASLAAHVAMECLFLAHNDNRATARTSQHPPAARDECHPGRCAPRAWTEGPGARYEGDERRLNGPQ